MQAATGPGWAPTCLAGPARRAASGSASSAWAGSVRRWRGARRPSACRSITTTASRFTPSEEAELEATYWESLDQMLARMDVISVNCPHTPSTFHLMNARRLKLMKPGCGDREHLARRGDRRERADPDAARGRDRGRRARRVREGARGEPAPAGAAQRGAAAAHGIGHAGGPGGDGREGHHQHQDLRRRAPAAGPHHSHPQTERPVHRNRLCPIRVRLRLR
jgi:hypothetical protein